MFFQRGVRSERARALKEAKNEAWKEVISKCKEPNKTCAYLKELDENIGSRSKIKHIVYKNKNEAGAMIKSLNIPNVDITTASRFMSRYNEITKPGILERIKGLVVGLILLYVLFLVFNYVMSQTIRLSSQNTTPNPFTTTPPRHRNHIRVSDPHPQYKLRSPAYTGVITPPLPHVQTPFGSGLPGGRAYFKQGNNLNSMRNKIGATVPIFSAGIQQPTTPL